MYDILELERGYLTLEGRKVHLSASTQLINHETSLYPAFARFFQLPKFVDSLYQRMSDATHARSIVLEEATKVTA